MFRQKWLEGELERRRIRPNGHWTEIVEILVWTDPYEDQPFTFSEALVVVISNGKYLALAVGAPTHSEGTCLIDNAGYESFTVDFSADIAFWVKVINEGWRAANPRNMDPVLAEDVQEVMYE